MLVHHVTLPEFTRGPPGWAKNPIQSTSPDSNRGNLTTDEKKLSTSIPPKVHHHAPGRQTPPRKQFETSHETTYPPIYERKDVGPADDPRARDAVREQAPLAQEHRAEAGRVAVEELQAARSQVGVSPCRPYLPPRFFRRHYPLGAPNWHISRSYGGPCDGTTNWGREM